MELARSGRLMVTYATWSVTSSRTSSSGVVLMLVLPRLAGSQMAVSVGVEVQRLFRARLHPQAGGRLVRRRHLVVAQRRVAVVVEGKQPGVDAVAQRVAGAGGLVESDSHRFASPGDSR